MINDVGKVMITDTKKKQKYDIENYLKHVDWSSVGNGRKILNTPM